MPLVRWLSVALLLAAALPAQAKPKIHIAFQWHMHQPVYWPYESVVQTIDAGRYGFNLSEVFSTRVGPYTAWPIDAVEQGLSLTNLGAQVSFTGSLIENLNTLEAAGRGYGNWKSRWSSSRSLLTGLGNPRLDLVLISYHHPLLPLIPGPDRRLQIALHRRALEQAFGPPPRTAEGMFPPETAFAGHIVPDLHAEGVRWVLVDNVHFDRARPDYPYTPGSNLVPPNPADQRNAGGTVNWVQLQNLWAPGKVSAPWGYQPHYVAYTDPETGTQTKIVAVPAARYEGNEDARGGFGAFLYEQVMSQYEQHNNDDAHPMLVVLHHDGDNYGGGTDSYYHSNFASFVAWLQSQPDRFESTTVQDYLDRFPPDPADVIHVEPGSWSGADNGDPEFMKWNGDPGADGYSPDRTSWAAIVAAANRVHTAQAISPYTSLDAILAGTGSSTDKAWHYLLNAETSCYWYWDYAENGTWDSHPTRGANLAVQHADPVLAGGADTVAPTIYLPQREPYNPGAVEWGTEIQPSDFEVWTFAYDVSGLTAVTLHWRVEPQGQVDAANLVYAGGTWQSLPMQATPTASRTDPQPVYLADGYRATIAGVTDALVDYYVSATDTGGRTARSPIGHVYVGSPGNPAAGVGWSPRPATTADRIRVWGEKPGELHWGVNGWTTPAASLWPPGSVDFGDGESVETPLAGPDAQGRWAVEIGPFAGSGVTVVDFVMHYDDGTWDSNGGSDFHIELSEPGPDAGLPPDSGTAGDAGASEDAGAGDDGGVVAADGGVALPDASLPVASDAGAGSDAGTGAEPEGCGCAAGGGGGGAVGLFGLALHALRRRRHGRG